MLFTVNHTVLQFSPVFTLIHFRVKNNPQSLLLRSCLLTECYNYFRFIEKLCSSHTQLTRVTKMMEIWAKIPIIAHLASCNLEKWTKNRLFCCFHPTVLLFYVIFSAPGSIFVKTSHPCILIAVKKITHPHTIIVKTNTAPRRHHHTMNPFTRMTDSCHQYAHQDDERGAVGVCWCGHSTEPSWTKTHWFFKVAAVF